MNLHAEPNRPPAWDVLEQALVERRAVRAGYHGHERVLSPHALGWKNGRAKLFAYQSGGTTSTGTLTPTITHRWRSMFLDELEQLTITDDPWDTADNYSPNSNGIDHLALEVSRVPLK